MSEGCVNSTCPKTAIDKFGQEAQARRQEFIAACWKDLGPMQREHVMIHCRAVSELAYSLAKVLRLSDEAAAKVRLAGLFHDIGKCAIPEELLAKAGPLSTGQRRIVDLHSWLGARYTLAITGDEELAQIVGGHHRGCLCPIAPFSNGQLSAQHLPALADKCLAAAIVQAADALASMTEDRPYAAARSISAALAELRRCSSSQFDPRVVHAAHQESVWSIAA